MPVGGRADQARLPGRHPDLCAGRNRPPRHPHADRRLCRFRACRTSEYRPTGRRHYHSLVQHAAGFKTIVFAVNVAHSRHIAAEYNKAGIKAEHLNGHAPKTERDAILSRLAGGNTLVVVNCKVLCEGYDLPDVACLVLARPTKQQGLYRQMVGRGLRPAPGKTSLVVLDHAGAIYRHGCVETPSNGRLSRTSGLPIRFIPAAGCATLTGRTNRALSIAMPAGQSACPERRVCIAAITPRGQPKPLPSRMAI